MSHTWKAGRVKDLIESLDSGVSVNGEDRTPRDDEPAVLKISAVTYGVFNPMASKPISGSELKRAKCNPKAGQIIISRSNTPSLVGACAFIERNYPNRYLSDKLWQTIPKNDSEVEMKWLAYFLASPWARYRLSNLATGTSDSMKNITKDELLTLPLPIPPIDEQRVIVSLLSTWDLAIEKVERLIAAKEKRFKWLYTQMILVPARVEKKWRLFRIFDIAERIQRKSDSGIYPILTIASASGFVLQEEKYSRFMAGKSLEDYTLLHRGEFAYNKGNSLRYQFGCVFSLQDYEKALVPHVYVCFKLHKDVDASYLDHVFKADYLKHSFQPL